MPLYFPNIRRRKKTYSWLSYSLKKTRIDLYISINLLDMSVSITRRSKSVKLDICSKQFPISHKYPLARCTVLSPWGTILFRGYSPVIHRVTIQSNIMSSYCDIQINLKNILLTLFAVLFFFAKTFSLIIFIFLLAHTHTHTHKHTHTVRMLRMVVCVCVCVCVLCASKNIKYY